MATKDKADHHESVPWRSKKFLAYQTAEITWKVCLFGLLIVSIKEGAINLYVGVVAMAIIIVAGAIEITYIGGQAALDKYVRVAAIVARSESAFKGPKLFTKETDDVEKNRFDGDDAG